MWSVAAEGECARPFANIESSHEPLQVPKIGHAAYTSDCREMIALIKVIKGRGIAVVFANQFR